MVVYFYLFLIISVSIITGILATIIEKRKEKRKKLIIQSIDLPTFIYSNKKSNQNRKKSKNFLSNTLLSKTIGLLELTKKANQLDFSEVKSYYPEPVISSILDEDVL